MANHQIFQNKVKQLQLDYQNQSNVKRIVYTALMSGFSAIFQSMGGFFPGLGFLISPLATAPILLCTVFSPALGFLSYFVTILLLLILQPSELVVFPFTTGALGLAIGVAIHHLRNSWMIILYGAIALATGIFFLLYVFKFPVLGPTVSVSISIPGIGGILVFSLLYSFLWLFNGKLLLKHFKFATNSK